MSAGEEPVPDLALAREFKAAPLGQHSPALQKLVRRFRTEPVPGKYGLLRIDNKREWMLVQFSGRKGVPLIEHPERRFSDWMEAEWAVFKLRWERHFGVPLEID